MADQHTKAAAFSAFTIPLHILDDLCSRFLINIPEEERQDLIRIFFQIELAHWFYLDFYCEENPKLKPVGIKDFSKQVFHHCPTLTDHADNVDKILDSWREYKMAVPTYGAILLDSSLQHCLLVQGFWSKSSWGFPKGKVNEEEAAKDCAVREVLEETGFDMGHLISVDEYIDNKMNGQLSRLYIIRDVPMETNFQPRTRKEIKHLDWFRVDQLPAHKKDMTCKQVFGLNPNSFFMVIPFIKPLRKWINKKLGQSGVTDLESSSSAIYVQKPSGARGSKSRDALAEPKLASEKQRQKLQQAFSQDMQAEYMEYMKLKEPRLKGKDQRTKSASPPPRQKPGGRTQTASPKSTSKKQILKRDAALHGPGNSRRSLATQFIDREPVTGHKSNEPFCSHAWQNFSLNVDDILASMFPRQDTR